MTTITGTTNIPLTIIDAEGVGYPCRCGEIHRGDYALEDKAMHECLHGVDHLAVIPVSDGTFQMLCPECGMSWRGEVFKEMDEEIVG